MSAIQILLFKQPGKLHRKDEVIEIEANQLIVTSEDVTATAISRDCWLNVYCYPGELHGLYNEISELIDTKQEFKHFRADEVKSIPVYNNLIKVFEQLISNREMLMKFVFIYCLSMDKSYFSNLFKYFLTYNDEVLRYIETNFMKPWPVNRFAEDLKVDARKLNFIFYKNYGVSAKKWLLDKRLSFARQQLLGTDKKVIDIAYESGFSNSSHFTDAFKKRYSCCPTTLRSSVN
ncbi:AraC family transcriptional regulator [Parashewanella curva]|uniref:AraC family transcriptional regulator n=1 Tax=Parashewanella curva TaxID=2338552 RepID=A0A3L8PWP1_9GAMM|nr:AraC family transcriptional regulator [Parashewanella curva]RLV59786.1 AraC family transcriptional regulator [Parashewanella curva]